MTTPTYAVNGITCHGVTTTWESVVKRQNADGTLELQPYVRHTWDIPQMEMSTFLSLQALQGTVLDSLATNDPFDRNSAVTYSGSVDMALISGQHVGRRAVGVRVEFRVLV